MGFLSYMKVIVHSGVSDGFEEPEEDLTNPALLPHLCSGMLVKRPHKPRDLPHQAAQWDISKD